MAKSFLLFISAPVCIFFIAATEISAETDANSVQVAGRAASFLKPSLVGSVTTAVIYEAGDAASEKEARFIERSLGNGLRVGAMTLKPKRVASHSLDQLADVRVAFVARGTNYRLIGPATASRSILSISFDPTCARESHCVMAISDGSRVQIIVSRAATKAANLRFNSSFLMLVKEI